MDQSQIRRDLYDLVSNFVVKNKITSAEAIYQIDFVDEFYEFMEEICDLIGYAEYTDETNEEDDEEL